MAGTPAWLSIRDAVDEILKRQRQGTGASPAGLATAPPDPYSQALRAQGVLAADLPDPAALGLLQDISWKSRKNRRDVERNRGIVWPRTEDGRNYDQHHTVPKSRGGADSWENIQPMHPLEHRRHHMENGDFREWGSWARKGRGGGPKAGALGWLSLFSDITGILSGRIRTDTLDNFASDLMGVPSQEDQLKALEEEQRAINPNWKPGDPIVA
jgi:hypothetical protein